MARPFDPLQRGRDFPRMPNPRRALLSQSAERQAQAAMRVATAAIDLAVQPPADTPIETLPTLPDPAGYVGKQVIISGAVGQSDIVYMGILDASGVPDWLKIGGGVIGTVFTWVRNFGVTNPYYAAVDEVGDLWVTRYDDHRIQKFDASGAPLATHGVTEATCTVVSGQQQMNNPRGIVDRPGNNTELVSRWDCHDVLAYNRSAGWSNTTDWAGTTNSPGSSNTQLNNPSGIAHHGSGGSERLYVADSGNDRVQVWEFIGGGTYDTTIGSVGTGNGQLNDPRDVAVDAGGGVYVADTGNNRIQKFSGGAYQWKVGGLTAGAGEGQFDAPEGIAVDPTGFVHVADTGNDRVQVFDADGAFQAEYGTSGTGDGNLDGPTGIAISSGGLIFVVDRGNDRVSVWE